MGAEVGRIGGAEQTRMQEASRLVIRWQRMAFLSGPGGAVSCDGKRQNAVHSHPGYGQQ
jgi:hypothetical protein